MLSLIFFACTNKPVEPKKLVEIIDYYENGKIKSKKVQIRLDANLFFIEEYFETGVLSKKGYLLDSIVTGYWEFFYENGNLEQKGNYIVDDSLNEGSFAFTYGRPLKDMAGNILEENDTWMCSLEMRERERHNLHVCRTGYWEFYHENGELQSKGSFNNGWSDGKYYEFHDNKQIALAAEFDSGKPIRKWRYYYSNGQLNKVLSYSNREEFIQAYYLEGGTKTLSDGTGTTYELDGKDSTVTEYKNHLKHGRDYTYRFRSISKKFEIDDEAHYVNGEAQGTWRSFNNYGETYLERLSSQCSYSNDELHGYYYQYFNKKKTSISYFVHGKEHGVFKDFHEGTGRLELVEPWIMGVRHGIRKYYTYKGEPETHQYFFEGEMVGKIEFEDGEITETTIYDGDTLKFNRL